MPSASWVNGWLSGDTVTVGEFKKGAGSIYDTALSGSAATIDINPPIPTGYAHLQLWFYARTDQAAATSSPQLRFNNDSAANYDFNIHQANNSASTVTASVAQTAATMGVCPGNTATANSFGLMIVDIPHYAGAANFKVALVRYAADTSAAAAGFWSGTTMIEWKAAAAAITRITLIPNTGNFVTGTRATLYVMGA